MYELKTGYHGEKVSSEYASFAVRSTGVYCMKFLAFLASAALVASPAFANSFTNGGFDTAVGTSGEFNFVTVPGWTSTGYNFIFAAGSADTTGSYTPDYTAYLTLWGPNNGSANGLTASSPSGGNFVGADGAFRQAPVQQVITGLTIGKTYSVGFDYGFAQQHGYDNATLQNWSVSFAGVTQTTATYALPNHAFSGWLHASYDFVATSASDTLSFLAYGDQPVPPFALLDGVTFTPDAVPEPATWAMLLTGFGAVGFAARRRRSGAVAA